MASVDSISVLKCLHTLDGTSLAHLVGQLVSIVQRNYESHKLDKELICKMLTLLAINGNQHVAESIIAELFLIAPPGTDPSSSSSSSSDNGDESNDYKNDKKQKPQSDASKNNNQETLLVNLRQEINPLHASCVSNVINSLVKSFLNSVGADCDIAYRLSNFALNVCALHEWDVRNLCFMSVHIASIVVERECFTNLVRLLACAGVGEQANDDEERDFATRIMALLNRVLGSAQEDEFKIVHILIILFQLLNF